MTIEKEAVRSDILFYLCMHKNGWPRPKWN